ncbi:MAG TPA: hypothetical protein VFE14_06040 [Micromonosporaceae bacterium]|jgi:3-hydroxyacyl-[acyl-carrier-protein] dehydratase|nr:hypothetical protein [Micromonosporaceae bacterium]
MTAVLVDAAEPLLAGHFPGFAIFPGVCLIECAHRAARTALVRYAGDDPVELVGIEVARFLYPVFPGDRVDTEVTVEPVHRGEVEDGWRCPARLTVGDQLAAIVRLRYTYLSKEGVGRD